MRAVENLHVGGSELTANACHILPHTHARYPEIIGLYTEYSGKKW